MNERIQELERQATTVVEGWSDENGTTRYYEFNKEKFAELIVQECAEIADDNYIHRGSRTCGLAIRQHFGVTE
jgi:hypothetical protein